MSSLLRLAAASMLAALPAAAEVPEVVADTPVVHALVAMVMGDLGAPVLLLDRGADAHDFQLRPSQLRALRAARLVVWTGPGMTPWLGHALEAGHAGQALALIDVPGTALRQFGSDDPGHADGESHDHGATDPHAWLDPGNAAAWTAAIAETLAALDAANAGTYRANAAAAEDRIAGLDAVLTARLAPARGRGLLIGHDAFGYFADHYGLKIAGSLAEGDAADPGARHLSALRSLAEAGEVVCAFPEAGHDPRPIGRVIAGTPAREGRPLDPEGRSAEPGPGLYLAVLDGVGAAIADCIAAE